MKRALGATLSLLLALSPLSSYAASFELPKEEPVAPSPAPLPQVRPLPVLPSVDATSNAAEAEFPLPPQAAAAAPQAATAQAALTAAGQGVASAQKSGDVQAAAPVLSATYDRARPSAASSPEPVVEAASSEANAALARPASAPQAPRAEPPASKKKAPSPRARKALRYAVAGLALATAALPPVFALAPAVSAFLGMTPGALLGVVGFAVGARAAVAILPRALEPIRDERKPRAAATVLGTLGAGALAGGAVGLLAMWSPLSAGLVLSAAVLTLAKESGEFRALEERFFPRPPELFTIVTRGNRRYLELSPDQLDKPYLFSATVERGLGEKDFYSARSWDLEFLWEFRRAGDHVELVARNTKFRARPGAPLEKAISRSVPDSAVVAARIVDEDRLAGRVTISLDDLLLQDVFDFAPQLGALYGGEYELDADLSRVESAKSYPANTEIEAKLSYFYAGGREDAPQTHLKDTRNLALTMRYSLSALPDDGFEPRRADDRVGHFTSNYQDWSDDQKPDLEVNLVNRWRLEKKDPKAAVSPVKKPIVYWIDPSVPKEYRGAVTRAVLAWNQAFERAGFLGAIEVKEAPDDGTFDPADARYNVIRWYLERDSGFAIGPARVNPLTGEIYNAGVAVSAYHPRFALGKQFKDILDVREDSELDRSCKSAACRRAHDSAHEAALTLSVLESRGKMSEEERRRFVEDYVTDLVLHEIGHTLGLRHNFLAKTYRSYPELGSGEPFVASVMDYVPVNLANPGEKQGKFWTTDIGPYDYWAIDYAYRPFHGLTPAQVEAELGDIARRSGEKGHAYATDEDVVGIDPSAQQWVLGDDGVAFGSGRMKLIAEHWRGLSSKELADGESYHSLYKGFIQGWFLYNRAARIVAKFVGGMYFRRHHAGDPGGGAPYAPVPGDKQREALRALADEVFADAPFDLPPDFLRRLAPRRSAEAVAGERDLTYLSQHELVLWLREGVLDQLLDRERLARLLQNERPAASGEKPLKVDELLDIMSASIFKELYGKVRTPGKGKPRLSISVMRRQLQTAYLARLFDLAYAGRADEMPEISTLAKKHVDDLFERISGLSERKAWDDATRTHLREMAYKISAALEHYEP